MFSTQNQNIAGAASPGLLLINPTSLREKNWRRVSEREIEGLGKQSQELLKRRTEDIDDHQLGGRKRKKRRFNVLEETWGLVSVEGVREIEEEGTHVKEGVTINHS